jgi:hypothetical protein
MSDKEVENRNTPERKRESTFATQEVRDAIIDYLEKEVSLRIDWMISCQTLQSEPL